MGVEACGRRTIYCGRRCFGVSTGRAGESKGSSTAYNPGEREGLRDMTTSSPGASPAPCHNRHAPLESKYDSWGNMTASPPQKQGLNARLGQMYSCRQFPACFAPSKQACSVANLLLVAGGYARLGWRRPYFDIGAGTNSPSVSDKQSSKRRRWSRRWSGCGVLKTENEEVGNLEFEPVRPAMTTPHNPTDLAT